MRMLILLPVSALALSGCVMVNPSNVSVTGFGSQSSSSKAPATPRTAYADALEKVIGQQEKVAHELGKRDWEELDEEANDWVEYTRTLLGYADTSHDPQLFRQYGDELLAATREVQRAAGQRDPSPLPQGPGCVRSAARPVRP